MGEEEEALDTVAANIAETRHAEPLLGSHPQIALFRLWPGALCQKFGQL